MAIKPRPEIQAAPAAIHGAIDHTECEQAALDPSRVLDFSANVSPFGPPPEVLSAIRHVPIDVYPDRDSLELRRALAAQWSLPPESIAVGNGSGELLQAIAFVYLRPGDRTLVIGPTYSEYARVTGLMGGLCLEYRASADSGFVPDFAEVRQMLAAESPRICFLCNPNNPTGTLLPADELASLVRDVPGTLFVIDEAYLDFVPGAESLISAKLRNAIVLRSMTKSQGLAGLRLGYAAASEEIVGHLRPAMVPWNVNALAQAAGIAASEARHRWPSTLRQLGALKGQLVRGLAELGLECLPSAAPFFLVRVGNAAAVRQKLLSAGILVRDCASFGLPDVIRISPRQSDDNELLLRAWGSQLVQSSGAADKTRTGFALQFGASRR